MDRIIRMAARPDASQVQAIYAPFCESSAISFEIVPPSEREMAARIEHTARLYPWLVCADGEQLLGYAYASRHRERAAYRWGVDVSAYVRADCRGQHIGKALYTALLELLRRQGFYKAYAGIALPNPASLNLHRSVGFREVGVYHGAGYKAGAWHDVSWWELALQDEVINPPEPRPITELLRTPRWQQAIALGERLLRA
jgi:L-amino acid N-acyltransferase YncA